MTETAKTLVLKGNNYSFDDLCEIMRLLRGENGCPWDKEQTHMSIRKNLIEETYEVVEAIDKNDSVLLREELGDLLLQVVFHSQLSEEEKKFDINGVCNDICQKLIIRHPHIFSHVEADTSAEVLKNWDEIKTKTKSQKNVTEKLNSIPPSLPSLMRAQKAGEKAAKVGFDFVTAADAFKKIQEESIEFDCSVKSGDAKKMKEEIGDLLFSVVNVARKYDIDAEEALYSATDKFVLRFSKVEKIVTDSGKHIGDMPMTELDAIWDLQK
ncbi:MAG: nucleoside triphosphate pyrophosphohydrolase [Clostridia bacterium]